jgi:hypothetical protein
LGSRVLKPEILDSLPAEEARPGLADLVRINRRWGGHSSLRKLIDETIRPGVEQPHSIENRQQASRESVPGKTADQASSS